MEERKTRRPSQKPAAIRAAAQRLFLQHGLQQTSMDTVAAEARVTKQTVYRHFGSKEQLFVAVLKSLVVERLHPDLLEAVPAGAQSGAELEDTLLTVANNILDHVLEPTYINLVRILVAEAREFPELAELFRTTAIQPMAAALTNLLGTPLNEDADHPGTVPAALRLFIAPLINYEVEAMLGDPTTVHKRARAELPAVVKLVATAIKASPDPPR
ncbi:MAG: TetR family transcriptional regulator [Nitriliruptorales bacterium]|nr:TetR family transcriptional regulator [Nitriliruptorales bacterium]